MTPGDHVRILATRHTGRVQETTPAGHLLVRVTGRDRALPYARWELEPIDGEETP